LRYEDLTEAPAETMKKLRDFLSLNDDPQLSAYAALTLRPNKAREPVALPDCISQEFHNVMKQLGYEN